MYHFSFGHQTWDLEGGQFDPSPAYPGFKYPSRNRVNTKFEV